jgi:putative metallohydrolase (TIGR04338 family)
VVTRPRDTQRAKVYKAERESGPRSTSAAGQRMYAAPKVNGAVTIPSVKAYVDEVCAARWFQSRYGRVRIPVTHCTSRAFGGANGIRFSRHERVESSILHEMAHYLVESRAEGKHAWHGEAFAATLLVLVDGVQGPAAAKQLRESFTRNRVKYRNGLAAVPKPGSRTVITKTAVARKRKAAATEPLRVGAMETIAESLRRAIKAGQFGPAGSASRKAALATARHLDKAAAGNVPGLAVAASRP